MRALAVIPSRAHSLSVREVPDPNAGPDQLLVAGLAMGVCGTDKEIAAGNHGSAPPGRRHLLIGHESLGRVQRSPADSGFAPGDLVAGVVRRPDPVPCGACAHGQFDMCRNGRYTERGIKELDGYGSQLWTVEPEYAIKLDPALENVGVLLEPTSVVAKAWDQVEKLGGRAWFQPRTVLVTGAGPIGLLAALLGTQRDLDVHVLDLVTTGPKPGLVRALGATYHGGESIDDVVRQVRPDVVIEATGAGPVIFGAIAGTAPYGIVCLTGVSTGGHRLTIDAGSLNRDLVLENDTIVGSVNANTGHCHRAASALAHADPTWLDRLITRRVPLERATEAFEVHDEDVKTVITLS